MSDPPAKVQTTKAGRGAPLHPIADEPEPTREKFAPGFAKKVRPQRAFIFTPRDPNFEHIAAVNEAGHDLWKCWLDYRTRINAPLALKSFYSRYAAWRSAGRPPQFSPSALVETRASARALVTTGGLAFIDAAGSALQIRRHALCVRFPDGTEHTIEPRDHRLKCVILAASGSITTEAVAWLASERVGLLVANKSLTAFSLFASEPTLRTDTNALALRRKQFAANALAVARHVVKLKIEASGLADADSRLALSRLAHATTVDGVIAVEAQASLIYWRKFKGFELRFKERDIPPAWRMFATRGNARQLKSGRAALFFANRDATSPLNAMSNYAYAVALAQVTRAICGLGLDPTFGFLHSDKVGRLSFAYDAFEPLRARIDDAVFAFASSRRFTRGEFVSEPHGVVRLGAPLARKIAATVLRNIAFHDYERAVLGIARSF